MADDVSDWFDETADDVKDWFVSNGSFTLPETDTDSHTCTELIILDE